MNQTIPTPLGDLSNNEHAPRAVAVFDLDGTLVRTDTFLPFLIGYALRRGRFRALAVLPVYLLLYACRLLSDWAAKERLLIAFCRSDPLPTIADYAERFSNGWVCRRLRPDVVAKLRQHQEAGHRVILLSASPDLYVPAIARSLGINEVICTRVSVVDGRCVGTLVGLNCKGPEKVEALKRHLDAGAAPAESHAYGDSGSDLPLLRWVSNGFLVKRGGLVRVSGEEKRA